MSKKNKAGKSKTNAMRILDRMKIEYEYQEYESDGFSDGVEVADKLGLAYDEVYKTLVTEGADREHYVFVIPVDKELDLKKAARAVSVKSVSMIHLKDLEPLTGYIRGGCTAIGMKKDFRTTLDISAEGKPYIYVSGGKRGSQIKLSPESFLSAAKAEMKDITKEEM